MLKYVIHCMADLLEEGCYTTAHSRLLYTTDKQVSYANVKTPTVMYVYIT